MSRKRHLYFFIAAWYCHQLSTDGGYKISYQKGNKMKALFSRQRYVALVVMNVPRGKTSCVMTELDYEMDPTDEALELMNARIVAWAERRRDEMGYDFELFLPVHSAQPHWRSGSRRVCVWGAGDGEIPL